MSYSKNELLALPLKERRELASELFDSILADETSPIADWKAALILEKIELDASNPGGGTE